jgi:hypothetical protein
MNSLYKRKRRNVDLSLCLSFLTVRKTQTEILVLGNYECDYPDGDLCLLISHVRWAGERSELKSTYTSF